MTRTILPLIALLLCYFTAPAWAQESWRWKPGTLELRGQDITFNWAVPKLLGTPGDTALWQKLLDKKVRDSLNEFQSAYLDARKEDAQIKRENPGYTPNPWESSGGYQVVWQDPRHLVLLWNGYDYRGGAHGLPVLEVTVLSVEQPDSLLPPTALFSDETRVLEALSTASRAELASQFGEPLDEWALKGTEPRWENFSIVYPSQVDGPARFEVIFPSYQVGPYAAGTPSVRIPWEDLASWAPGLRVGVPLP